jgi:hypothetical protein
MSAVYLVDQPAVEPFAINTRPVRGGCRFCGTPFKHRVVDLGMSPLCESYLRADQINQMEPFYPLHVWVCEECFLVQLEEYVTGEDIFTDYAYFSSFSDSWLQHCRQYVDQMVDQLGLTSKSHVVEVASNDGYLLQYFIKRGISALGIEPAANVAKVAEAKGVPTLVKFFGVDTARELATEASLRSSFRICYARSKAISSIRSTTNTSRISRCIR